MAAETSAALADSGPNDYESMLAQLEKEQTLQFSRIAVEAATDTVERIDRSNTLYFDRYKRRFPAVNVSLPDVLRPKIDSLISASAERFTSIPAEYYGGLAEKIRRNLFEIGTVNLRDVYLDALTHLPELDPKSADRRARFIARNTNAQLTGEINRSRSMALGITDGIWIHSSAARFPRPSHVKAGQERLVFSLERGAYLWEGTPKRGKYIWVQPGELFNCGCTYRIVLP